jgi:hypothetical protein
MRSQTDAAGVRAAGRPPALWGLGALDGLAAGLEAALPFEAMVPSLGGDDDYECRSDQSQGTGCPDGRSSTASQTTQPATEIGRDMAPLLPIRDKFHTDSIRVLDQPGRYGCHTVRSLFHRR